MPFPQPAAGAVGIADNIDERIAYFKIVTESATYFYDKALPTVPTDPGVRREYDDTEV